MDATGNVAHTIALDFGDDVQEPVRARIFYAFQVFAAVYGYRLLESDLHSATIRCTYGETSRAQRIRGALHIPALYRITKTGELSTRAVKHRYAGEELCLFYGTDPVTGNPDWLGEIFWWLSSSHEMQATGRDAIGRIPFSESVFSRQQLSSRKPHVNLLMAWMQNVLCNGSAVEALPKAPSPVPGVEHLLVSSHDIDFYYSDRTSALVRLIKNLGISWSIYRSRSYFVANVVMLRQVLAGDRVGDYLPALLDASERYRFKSTVFVVARHGHRRDPDHDIRDITPRLHEAAKRGFEVALHGSYSSVIEMGDLAPETAALERAMGKKARGGRQHWLRFDRHKKLFDCVEGAGLLFDSTLGFSDRVGFRNGASFAFPPYDFRDERPHNFLEIPLALMDGSIAADSRGSGEPARDIANEVLRGSRKYGWGGIAALWHNPIEAISVPPEINEIFWDCVKSQEKFQEKWISAEQFLACSLHRYQNAGLLKGVRLDA